MCHSFTFTMRPCFYRYTKIIKINYKKSQVFFLDNTITLSSSFLLLDIKQFIVHPLLFLDNSRRPSPGCLYVCVHKLRWQLNYMKVNVALVICVNSKALNTHIWEKMDCVVAKLICDHFMQRSVYMPCMLQTSFDKCY